MTSDETPASLDQDTTLRAAPERIRGDDPPNRRPPAHIADPDQHRPVPELLMKGQGLASIAGFTYFGSWRVLLCRSAVAQQCRRVGACNAVRMPSSRRTSGRQTVTDTQDFLASSGPCEGRSYSFLQGRARGPTEQVPGTIDIGERSSRIAAAPVVRGEPGLTGPELAPPPRPVPVR